jgi:hypothetical protein
MSGIAASPDTTGPVGLAMLAYRLRLPRAWLHSEALARRIPCLGVGNRLLFNLAAVRRTLSARAAEGQGVPRA